MIISTKACNPPKLGSGNKEENGYRGEKDGNSKGNLTMGDVCPPNNKYYELRNLGDKDNILLCPRLDVYDKVYKISHCCTT